MYIKKIAALSLATFMISATAVTAYAGTLTDQSTSGNTEVIAHIDGIVPGNVSYKITIPDVVDFGTLVQPETQENSYKAVGYQVSLDEVNGLDADKQISVYVKDQNAKLDDNQNFYIANKANNKIQFMYNVFAVPQDNVQTNQPLNSIPYTKTAGYYLTGFERAGETLDGTLVINQAQLYGQSIADIAGDYSGYMVFYSTVENK